MKNNIINTISNDNTYSKERVSTNYNHDLDLNISDIKANKIKIDKNDNNLFFNNNNKFNNNNNNINKNNNKIEDNTNTIIKNLKSNSINNKDYHVYKDLQKKEKIDIVYNGNKEEIKSNINIGKDSTMYDNNNKNEYKIYDVNTFRKISKNENSINNSNNKKKDVEENTNCEKNEINNKKDTINADVNKEKDFIKANFWIENENEKNKKLNFDEYINKTKEKLNQIRNNNSINNSGNTKRKIKSTLNYILRSNNNEKSNDNWKSNENEENDNDKNKLINLKGNSNNKFVIKTSNRMQNFLSNIRENQNKKNNYKMMENKKYNNVSNIDYIPNIKSIIDKKNLEVFDEDEFIKIRKRNFTSSKVKNYALNKDLRYLDKTLQLQNIRKTKYNINIISNKSFVNENVLPPNNINFKEMFNKTLIEILKK
jgi:hypothetical protein